MNSYCTLFDSNYLDKGLVMYYSLKRKSDNFMLYVIAFDEKCYQILQKLKLANLHVISLLEFEDENLLSIKNKRKPSEYCWTCSSYAVNFVLKNYNVNSCTYVDADLFFYEDPYILLLEIAKAKADVGIIGHRFGKGYENRRLMNKAGRYCVQFNTFMNNKNGMQILSDWMKMCLECCSSIPSKTGFGDQKYLNNWKDVYQNVFEHDNLGAGIAPWNLSQYKYVNSNNSHVLIAKKKENNPVPIIFYHFHGIRYIKNSKVDIGISARPGSFDKKLIKELYVPYLVEIQKVRIRLKKDFGLRFENNNIGTDKSSGFNMVKELLSENNIYIIFKRVYRYITRKKIDIIYLDEYFEKRNQC